MTLQRESASRESLNLSMATSTLNLCFSCIKIRKKTKVHYLRRVIAPPIKSPPSANTRPLYVRVLRRAKLNKEYRARGSPTVKRMLLWILMPISLFHRFLATGYSLSPS